MLAALPITPMLTEFTDCMDRRRTPDEVLETLHVLASKYLAISVLGAARFPLKTSDWRSTRLGKDAFLHPSVPKGWWEEYVAMAKREQDPGVMMARSSLMGCTLTETVRMLEPIGIDRWPIELSHKFGMRDALTCSVGRRWLVSYWSSKSLHNVLTQPGRILLFAAASFAALRLEQLIDHDPRWMGKRIIASPRGSLRFCDWFRLVGATTRPRSCLVWARRRFAPISRRHRASSAFAVGRTLLVKRSDRT